MKGGSTERGIGRPTAGTLLVVSIISGISILAIGLTLGVLMIRGILNRFAHNNKMANTFW